MQTNTIHCGECAEMMRQHLPDNSIDLTVTSPPYDDLREYNGYTFEFEPIAAELWRVTKPGGVVVWVVGDATVNGSETGTSFKHALGFMGLGFRLHDTMIYQTDKPPMNDNRYQASFEFMFILSKGKPKTFNPLSRPALKAGLDRVGITYRQSNGEKKDQFRGGVTSAQTVRNNIWYIPAGWGKSSKDKDAYQHPAIFPEALARDHIISWSNPGDIVLDPMCGSGTTLKMAVEQGRQYIGIDISQEYVDLAQQRVNGARVPLPGLTVTVHNKQLYPNCYPSTPEQLSLIDGEEAD